MITSTRILLFRKNSVRKRRTNIMLNKVSSRVDVFIISMSVISAELRLKLLISTRKQIISTRLSLRLNKSKSS